ncbi:MAG: hypothetical protein IRZ14_09375 [Chloroflexi bacterium]|nr:hypothetical protein [Chloroflexota bacterium]
MRERLRRDPFFFALLLAALGFAIFGFGVTWWYFRDPWSLALAIACAAGAVVLFGLRG